MNDDVPSPYMQAPVPTNGMESQDVTQVLVHDVVLGAQAVIGVASEVVLVDPNGTRRFLQTKFQRRSTDGRLLRDPTAQGEYSCRQCGTDTFSIDGVLKCFRCGFVLCRKKCAKIHREVAWCRSCWIKTRAKEFLEAVFSCPHR
jgi:hypothetical protein